MPQMMPLNWYFLLFLFIFFFFIFISLNYFIYKLKLISINQKIKSKLNNLFWKW